MTHNIIVLAFLLVLNAFIILCWWINGGVCFLSPLEQLLDGVNYKYSNGIKKTFIAVYLEKIVKYEKLTFILITIIPLLNILIILYKISTYKAMCDLSMAHSSTMV